MRNPIMKLSSIALAGVFALSGTLAFAQAGSNNGGPSDRGSTMGDPAASSATPGTSPTVGSSMKANPSGSGTSMSGGSDANGRLGHRAALFLAIGLTFFVATRLNRLDQARLS